MPQLLVCEDDARLSRLLVKRLAAVSDFAVQACDTGEKACELIVEQSFDLLLLDLELPGIGGLEVLDWLRERGALGDLEVLILTTFRDEGKVFRAMQGGAAGYLVKSRGLDRLEASVREVLAGGSVLDPALGRRFWNHFASQRGRRSGAVELTEREREVLGMVAKGLTNPEAASALGRSERSIKSELGRIYRKLGVCGRVEATAKALRSGLIDL